MSSCADSAEHASKRRLLRLSYLGFISLGLPDAVLGAAWPALRTELGLPLDAAGGLLLVTTAGVVLSSAGSHWLRSSLGTGAVLVGSTLLAAGALLATALAQHWTPLFGAAFVAGLGGGAIDASLNEHVARNHDARQLSWLHACWGIGAASGPLVVASVLATGASWRVSYGILGVIEALLMLSFLQTSALWREQTAAHAPHSARGESGLRWPMVASVLLFYVYGGLEASAGLWASSLLTVTRGTTVAAGGAAVGLFWTGLTVGRIAIGLHADAHGPVRVLRITIWVTLGATIALAIPHTPAWFLVGALLALGFALSPVYPLAMHDTPTRFGVSWGTRLVGYQVAAASLGVATLPWLVGAISERSSLLVLPCLFVVLAVCLLGLQRARLQGLPRQ